MDRHAAETHDALQAIIGDPERSDIEELDGAILTGWVLVGEVMFPDGTRGLIRWSGPEAITGWLRDGMLHEALHGEWSDPTDRATGDAPDDEDDE